MGLSFKTWRSDSLEYLSYPLIDSEEDESVDPSNTLIDFAFKAVDEDGEHDEPESGDWIDGEWAQDADTGIWYARIPVGPDGDFEPTADTLYKVYARIEDADEVPVVPMGLLYVNP